MNWDTVEGKWKQMGGKVKEKWGDLTDDQIAKTEGKRDQFAGLLQEQYGMTREKAENAMNSWANRVHEENDDNSLSNVWNNVQGRWSEMVGNFKEEYGKATDNDLTESQGRRDQLAGMIQREYNISRGEAYDMVDDWAYGTYKNANLKEVK